MATVVCDTPSIHCDSDGNPLTSRLFNSKHFDASYQALQKQNKPKVLHKPLPLPAGQFGPNEHRLAKLPPHMRVVERPATVLKQPKPKPTAPVVEPVVEPATEPVALKPAVKPLADLTLAALRKLASDLKLAGRSKLNKAGLVAALEAARA